MSKDATALFLDEIEDLKRQRASMFEIIGALHTAAAKAERSNVRLLGLVNLADEMARCGDKLIPVLGPDGFATSFQMAVEKYREARK